MFNIGNSSKSIDFDDAFESYTQVKLYDKSGKLYTAGNNSGRTLTLTSPFATQQMCNEMLAQVQTSVYQPFETTGSIYDPSMDLGDSLSVYGTDSTAFSLAENYGSLVTASISAPSGEQIDHEIPFQSASGRAMGRLEDKANANESKILEAHNELIAALNGDDGAPIDLAAGLQNYVRYDLENDKGWASSALFAKIGEQTDAKVEAYVDSEIGSLVSIKADLVAIAAKKTTIDAMTFVGGSLSVTGNIRTNIANGSIEALNGTIIGKTVAASESFTLKGEEYKPTQITSISGKKYSVLAC
ncbi:MAG: hypothetical protein KBS60_04245 [Phascolarctobacterium sp.]|nr:hypothetical protein [Candidatus Phascolarctobacterium caballi]